MKAFQSGSLAVLLAFSVFAAAAATADSSAIAHLRSEAIRNGAVAVTANLASLSLSELGDPIKRAEVRGSTLLCHTPELPAHQWPRHTFRGSMPW